MRDVPTKPGEERSPDTDRMSDAAAQLQESNRRRQRGDSVAGTAAAPVTAAARAVSDIDDDPSQPAAADQESDLLDTDKKLGDMHNQGAVAAEGGEEGMEDSATTTLALASTASGSSRRLAALAPTFGRMASAAQKISAPYLSYAAQASQEAARYL